MRKIELKAVRKQEPTISAKRIWVGENSFGSRYMCGYCNTEHIGIYDSCPTCKAKLY